MLEHIHNVKEAINEMARVTKPGGINIHSVDLRDHFFKATPLRLLQFSDWIWNLMTWNRPGYTNRFRLSDYMKLFKSSDFLVKKLETTRKYAANLSSLKIARKFKEAYLSEELKILSFWVLLQK